MEYGSTVYEVLMFVALTISAMEKENGGAAL
jgi:hypothetical protein